VLTVLCLLATSTRLAASAVGQCSDSAVWYSEVNGIVCLHGSRLT
jgi:hypothetical protein